MSTVYSFTTRLPKVVFKTKNSFDDYSTDDMRHGDMDEEKLKVLGIDDISSTVDPYRLIKYNASPLNFINSEGIYNSKGNIAAVKISHDECVDILFNEMKLLSEDFSQGKYVGLIIKLIDHFRYGNGFPFYDPSLNQAYRERIERTRYENPLAAIKLVLKNRFGAYPPLNNHTDIFYDILVEILNKRLPKFDQKIDRRNGLGISIHDIHVQEIKIIRFMSHRSGWDCLVNFKAQDHFGLDINDINDPIYKQFRFFRIWFFLQRHHNYNFKPFLTNMSAAVNMREYL